jgi:ribosomal protein S18 acetylase RimI-like enzyme
MALQHAYNNAHKKVKNIIPGEVYLSPGFAAGKNVFCAFTEDCSLQGYAALFANIATAPDVPHRVWAVVKVNPLLTSPHPLQDELFNWAVNRAGIITQPFPGHEKQLTFQHHVSEVDVIEYLKSKGCVYTESVFRMSYNLSGEPLVPPVPGNIDVNYCLMDDVTKQQIYVTARNEAFPASATTLTDWQFFLSTIISEKGKVIAAYENQELVGSALIYWDEALNRRIGIEIGTTEYIFVRDGWRKKGIASYMIYLGLKHLKDHGLKQAHLEVYASNQNALDLYKKLGYKVINETQLFVLKI